MTNLIMVATAKAGATATVYRSHVLAVVGEEGYGTMTTVETDRTTANVEAAWSTAAAEMPWPTVTVRTTT